MSPAAMRCYDVTVTFTDGADPYVMDEEYARDAAEAVRNARQIIADAGLSAVVAGVTASPHRSPGMPYTMADLDRDLGLIR